MDRPTRASSRFVNDIRPATPGPREDSIHDEGAGQLLYFLALTTEKPAQRDEAIDEGACLNFWRSFQ
jgi:hypothetical protein